MTVTFGGPMFERAVNGPWKSVHNQDGAHYNTYAAKDADGMRALRNVFPEPEADDLNFCLFSTSGVHGMYTTIEEAEADWRRGGKDEDGEPTTPSVTFLVVQPRIVCLRYGNCLPQNEEDFAYLKRLRETSLKALAVIGLPSPVSESEQ